MSKIDLQKYFEDTLTFTFEGQDFKVDESNKAYQLCQKEIQEVVETATDEDVYNVTLKHALGEDNAKKILDMNLPIRTYREMSFEIMSAWTGLSVEQLKKRTGIETKTPSK